MHCGKTVNTCRIHYVMTTAHREGNLAVAPHGENVPQDSKALTVRVPVDLWKSVKIKCVQEDTNIQAVLASYLRDWTDNG